MIYVVLAIFVLSYGLLIFRKIRGRTFPIWSSMVIGAALSLATLSITPIDAFNAIDFRVLSFLFGMLVITSGFEKSGLIEFMVLWLLRKAGSIDRVLFYLIFGAGILSAFLLNDTIALMLAPLAISVSSKIGVRNQRALLMPLAFGITTGSVFTPIGNPQNLLVALDSGIPRPFSQFATYLFVPTIVSLFAVYILSKFFFRRELNSTSSYPRLKETLPEPNSAISDFGLAKLSVGILVALIVSFIAVEVFPTLQNYGINLYTLSFACGLLLLVLSPRRLFLILDVNWGVLIFFAGMFVLMRAVWDSGIGPMMLSVLPTPNHAMGVQSTGAIILDSVTLSQVLSNVPFVQLYAYEMATLGFTGHYTIAWLALAAGSTLAGNLTILGAVSNVIIVDAAEIRKSKSFTFFEFLKYGVVVTVVTCLIYFGFLSLF
jgi:Na+/H+ antiporter NhaD/arsenite permease-like protein